MSSSFCLDFGGRGRLYGLRHKRTQNICVYRHSRGTHTRVPMHTLTGGPWTPHREETPLVDSGQRCSRVPPQALPASRCPPGPGLMGSPHAVARDSCFLHPFAGLGPGPLPGCPRACNSGPVLACTERLSLGGSGLPPRALWACTGQGACGVGLQAAAFYLLSTGVPGALQLPPRPSCGVPRPCPHFSAQVLRLCLGARRRCEHKPIRYTWQAYTRCPIPATTGPPDTATTVDL